jgi:hypothetical protein
LPLGRAGYLFSFAGLQKCLHVFSALAVKLAVSGSAGYPLRRLQSVRSGGKTPASENVNDRWVNRFHIFGLPVCGQPGKSAVAPFASRQIIWREFRLDRLNGLSLVVRKVEAERVACGQQARAELVIKAV